MTIFSNRPRPRRWPFILLALQTCWATARSSSSIVEVDLVFPRDGETYDAGPLFPIVFAIQNPTLAAAVNLKIIWLYWDRSLRDPVYVQDHLRQTAPDFNRANLAAGGPPFFAGDSILDLHATERTWGLRWMARYDECLGASTPSPKILHGSFMHAAKVITFSTKKGAQQPDISSNTTACVMSRDWPNVTFTATDAGKLLPDGQQCIMVETPRDVNMTTDPCGPVLDTAGAANVSAAITASYCASATATPVVSCPPTSPGAGRLGEGLGWAWLMSGLLLGSLQYLAA